MSGKKETPFVLKYSNHVIEHLGVKLYQNKPTNALTELIANGWDADAENVWIDLRLDDSHENWWISVGDDGVGMTQGEVQEDYLVIGRKRRVEVDEKTPKRKRPLMGRKGIGKLAPFGIAKVVDVFTTKEGQVTWISLDLAKMLEQSEDPNQHTTYEPKVKFVGAWTQFEDGSLPDALDLFLQRLRKTSESPPSGTLILLQNLTFSSKGWSTLLKARLANRLVPVLVQADFTVSVDDELIDLQKELPSHSLKLPEDKDFEILSLPNGREVQWKVLIVDLNRYKEKFGEAWTQERSGVSVYAHGKIAQDRPFFFGLTGREIYSRYLYGVVIADWIDELDEDVMSTDRASVNWEHPDLVTLKDEGRKLVRQWANVAQKYLQDSNRKKVNEKVQEKLRKVPSQYKDRFSTKEVKEMALTILSLDPSPSIGKVVEITISAVAHLPSWELLKGLVQKVQEGDISGDVFEQIVFDFRFFENVNLAQVIARRLQVMLALKDLIDRGAREVEPGEGDKITEVRSMHQLIENNPWLLDLRWAAVADELPPQLSQQALESVEKRLKEDYGEDVYEFENWREIGKKAIDFFLIHVTDFENVVIVVEIKRANKSLTKRDHRQLEDYLDEVRGVLRKHSGTSEWGLSGILIGGSIGPQLRTHLQSNPYPSIKTTTWEDLLLDARRSHQEFLTALAMRLHDDPRLKTYLVDLDKVRQGI